MYHLLDEKPRSDSKAPAPRNSYIEDSSSEEEIVLQKKRVMP